jgi:hypothetical protein
MLFLLFASAAFAQDEAAAARAAAGCGPSKVEFNLKTDKKRHPIGQPEPGKALVYVLQEEKLDPGTLKIGSFTTRAGVDSTWTGANHGNSYFYFSVEPGEHNLCVSDQATLTIGPFKRNAAVSFAAEASQSYFFRAIVESRSGRQPGIYVEPIDPAEGKLLIAASSLSTFQQKK